MIPRQQSTCEYKNMCHLEYCPDNKEHCTTFNERQSQERHIKENTLEHFTAQQIKHFNRLRVGL